jgi:hypothetical protein
MVTDAADAVVECGVNPAARFEFAGVVHHE